MTRVETAVANIVFARAYTARLIDSIPPADWFRVPAAGVSHVAWQVGHLAMAQYRLVFERTIGRHPDDESLISSAFLKTFGRDSVVDPDPTAYPPAAEIRAVFDRVHARTLAELPAFSDDNLDGPALTPHSFCKTKWECLRWCSHHEFVHSGQIGLLRRQLGQKPLW